MNRRTATVAAGVAVLLVACAVSVARLVVGCIPGVDCIESGYSPPATMVLVSADGHTLWAGWLGCAENATLEAVQTPGSVVLRVYWRRHRTFQCGSDVQAAAVALTLSYHVRLSSPLAARRLVGPDGVALAWLDEARMLSFRDSGRRYPWPLPLPAVSEPMFPAAKCLGSHTNAGLLRLSQCAYRSAAGGTPALGPTTITRPDASLMGLAVTVRGRTGHVVDHLPNEPPWAGFDFPWRALWWIGDNRIVVLTSERFATSDPPLLSVSQLVDVANELSCQQPVACRGPG